MTQRLSAGDTLLGVDVGSTRVGLAISRGVRVAVPLTTVTADESVFKAIATIAKTEQASGFIIGRPRGMQGQSTSQTAYAETFAGRLSETAGLPYELQDEALTSIKAETELRRRGKPYSKADVDSLAATFILEDFLNV